MTTGRRGAHDVAAREVRRPFRAGADRPEDGAESVLSGAVLDRLRGGASPRASPLSRDEGRGWLGNRLRRAVLDLTGIGPRTTPCPPAALGRRRHAESHDRLRRGSRTRKPHRRGAVARRCERRLSAEPSDPGCSQPAPVGQVPAQLPARARRRGDSRHSGALRDGSASGTERRLRHSLRLRGPREPAEPVPVSVLQQANGRVRGEPREPREILDRDAAGGTP